MTTTVAITIMEAITTGPASGPRAHARVMIRRRRRDHIVQRF